MASVFNRTNEANLNVPRNTFDLSFQNNLTMTLGGLYPAIVLPVVPGDSVKIDPVFGLRFMPLTFPIQTKMTANLHFFYVRNRNLWKDWQEFITNSNGALTDPTKQAPVPPYFGPDNKTKFSTGSLVDYMGIPTTSYDSYANQMKIKDFTQAVYAFPSSHKWNSGLSEALFEPPYQIPADFDGWKKRFDEACTYLQSTSHCNMDTLNIGSIEVPDFKVSDAKSFVWEIAFDEDFTKVIGDKEFTLTLKFFPSYWKEQGLSYQQVIDSLLVCTRSKKGDLLNTKSIKSFIIDSSEESKNSYDFVSLKLNVNEFPESSYGYFLVCPFSFDFLGKTNAHPADDKGKFFMYVVPHETVLNNTYTGIADVPFSQTPWHSKKRLSTLAFRAYESIYNSFYRDVRNNPLMVDGQPVYNKYILNDDGGVDNTTYELHYRNWEPDFLTTAVQTPQQGIAPLVGISSSGTMKFADDAGNVYTAQAEFADDGETITSFKVNSPDMPQGNLRALVDLASSGISINDFRNVNALQRYLETNMRKGLRYVDWIKGHFDVEPSYSTLDMPEFLGGVSQPVNVQQVTQTVETNDTPLGDVAGQATCMGASRSITRYCDEHGFIIGILSVSPVPNYSQLLPKHFLFSNPLDYYTPEFGHIGYQPITYAEVCPLSTHLSGQNLDDVFGYQRAWYDMIARVDEVHGDFRTTLQDYLINRYFKTRPELGRDFLTIDPDTVNKPFVVQSSDNQPILGQIYFKIAAKRPIPAVGIPRLE